MMKKYGFMLLSLMIIPLLVVSSEAQETEDVVIDIPKWVKSSAEWWSQDRISDAEYVDSLEFLIAGGIIQMDSISMQSIIPVEEEDSTDWELVSKMYEGDIVTYKNEIVRLENEVESFGLDNSKLLQSIVEKIQEADKLTNDLQIIKDEFKIYKQEYPLKVENIGDNQVYVDTIRQIEVKIQELYKEIDKLEESYSECKEFRDSYKHIGTNTNYYLEMTEYREKYERTLPMSKEKDNTITDLTNEIELKNTTIEELEIINENLQKKISELEQQE